MSLKREPRGHATAQSGHGPLRWSFGLIALLACFCLLPRVSDNQRLLSSFAAATGSLLIFAFLVHRQVVRTGRTLTYEFLPRKVHYVQFVMHSSVYLYWGWYWREVYHDLSLIAAQIVFAYAVDALVCWSRRDKWMAGFGPIPIVMSTNLFLWFKDDWFFLQFLLIATGLLGKEFIRWKREGRLTHIFNPSAFSLFIFSIVLIATKSTDLSWGFQIATTFHRPPHIYLEIFLLGLVVQSLFRVTLVTLSAAAALYGLNLWYTGMTGDYQFVDSNIPVAVFLGLHLLVTDPATSPRSSLGKILFGGLYGVGVFGAYGVLKLINAPEFYDKLLVVPPLNLSVRALDRFSDAVMARLRPLNSVFRWQPQQANFAWMGAWICLFVIMTASGFLVKGADHPGSNPAYWAKMCQQGRSSTCQTWVRVLDGGCQAGSGPDCMSLAVLLEQGRFTKRDENRAGVLFGRACDSGVQQGCLGLVQFMRSGGRDVMLRACDQKDGASCFILGSLFSSGYGLPKDPTMAFELFQKSCDMGWWRGCGRLGVSYLVGQGTAVNPPLAIANFEKGCGGENAASCWEAAQFYHSGKFGRNDELLASQRRQQACDLGLKTACQQAAPPPRPTTP
jgi:hypothetical protein